MWLFLVKISVQIYLHSVCNNPLKPLIQKHFLYRSPVFLETVRNSKVREIGLFSLQLQLKTVRNREVFAIYLQSAYFDWLRILELNMHIFSLLLLNQRDLGVLK